MKALVYTAPQQTVYREEPDPVLVEGDALVRVGATGICGSDLHAWLGHDDRRIPPLVLGHEAAGTLENGQAVVINPLITCGRCHFCVSGRTNLCGSRQIVGMTPRVGTHAEYLAIPAQNLIPIPPALSMAQAALAEPIATAWHAVTAAARLQMRPLSEAKAFVMGGGAVGLSAALALRAFGCRQVFLGETNPLRRQTAKNEEVAEIFNPQTDALPEKIDVVIDAVGGKQTRQSSCAAVSPGGVIVHVGLLEGSEGLDVRRLTLQEITFMGVYTYTMVDFQATVAAMASGALGALNWFEQRPLAEGATAFQDLIHGRTEAAKIILTPEP